MLTTESYVELNREREKSNFGFPEELVFQQHLGWRSFVRFFA